VEKYLQRAKRYLADFTTETRSEERFENILSLADKIKHLAPSAEQTERYWNIVELGQQKLAALVPTVRVSSVEHSETELDSRELGSGAIL
jgi:hypothetical protein